MPDQLSVRRPADILSGEVPMGSYVLALDQGTTSSRAIVFDHGGNIVAMVQK